MGWKAALAVALAAFALQVAARDAAGLSTTDQSSTSASADDSATLTAAHRMTLPCGTSSTCCSGLRCPYSGGQCCGDGATCCPYGAACVPNPSASGQMCSRSAFRVPGRCSCVTQPCSCQVEADEAPAGTFAPMDSSFGSPEVTSDFMTRTPTVPRHSLNLNPQNSAPSSQAPIVITVQSPPPPTPPPTPPAPPPPPPRVPVVVPRPAPTIIAVPVPNAYEDDMIESPAQRKEKARKAEKRQKRTEKQEEYHKRLAAQDNEAATKLSIIKAISSGTGQTTAAAASLAGPMASASTSQTPTTEATVVNQANKALQDANSKLRDLILQTQQQRVAQASEAAAKSAERTNKLLAQQAKYAAANSLPAPQASTQASTQAPVGKSDVALDGIRKQMKELRSELRLLHNKDLDEATASHMKAVVSIRSDIEAMRQELQLLLAHKGMTDEAIDKRSRELIERMSDATADAEKHKKALQQLKKMNSEKIKEELLKEKKDLLKTKNQKEKELVIEGKAKRRALRQTIEEQKQKRARARIELAERKKKFTVEQEKDQQRDHEKRKANDKDQLAERNRKHKRSIERHDKTREAIRRNKKQHQRMEQTIETEFDHKNKLQSIEIRDKTAIRKQRR